MKAKEFIYSRSQELAEAIDNGYDLRLSEPDILYWMEKYAEYKAKNLPIHNVSKSVCDCKFKLTCGGCVFGNAKMEECKEYVKQIVC